MNSQRSAWTDQDFRRPGMRRVMEGLARVQREILQAPARPKATHDRGSAREDRRLEQSADGR